MKWAQAASRPSAQAVASARSGRCSADRYFSRSRADGGASAKALPALAASVAANSSRDSSQRPASALRNNVSASPRGSTDSGEASSPDRTRRGRSRRDYTWQVTSARRFKVNTKGQGDAHDITDPVAEAARDVRNGLVTVFVVGSTAAITTI